MKKPTRFVLGLRRVPLVLALGFVVTSEAAVSITLANENEFEFPAQEPPGNNNGPTQNGHVRLKVVPWQKPTEPAPAWLDQNTDKNEIEDSIRSALEQRLDIDFNAVPLSKVMQFIAEKLDITIQVDDKALEEESITPEEPVTWKQSNVKARDVINQILAPLQLTYKIEAEAVLITSRKSSANVVRAYDLSYVLPDSGLLPEVVGTIETMVQPTEWEICGGHSSLRTVGCLLLVSAPEETQRSVERLLRQISKQLPANMKRKELEANPAAPTSPTTNAKPQEKLSANGVAETNATGGGVAFGFGLGNAKGAGGVAFGFTGNQPLPAQQMEAVQQWEKPKKPTPEWLDEVIDVSEIENRIRHSLDKQYELNFNGQPLSGVMKFFKGTFDIPIIFDEAAMEEVMITTDEPVTLELPPTSFRESLRLILTPLKLTYVIQKEHMVITSINSEFASVQSYDLSFILPDSGLISEIIGTIEAVVSPDKWQIAGGSYTMRSAGSILVVRADEETHYEIQRLLRSICKQPQANMKPRLLLPNTLSKPQDREVPKPAFGSAPF